MSVDDLDSGWELPDHELEETKEIFHYVDTGIRTNEVLQDVYVSGEASLLPLQEMTDSVFSNTGLKRPERSFIIGGAKSNASQAIMQLNGNELVAVTAPGITPSNGDAISAVYDKKRSKLRVFLSHGPQHYDEAAGLASVGAVKGMLECARKPSDNISEMVHKAENNIYAVMEEIGSTKKASLSGIEMNISIKGAIDGIDLVNLGTNHCMVLNPETGSRRIPKNMTRRIPDRAEIQHFFDEAHKKLTPEGLRKMGIKDNHLKKAALKSNNEDGLAEIMIRLFEKTILTADGATELRKRLSNSKGNVVDAIDEFFKNCQDSAEIKPGEVVIVFTDELLKTIESRKGGHLNQLANRFFIDLNNGIPLDKICMQIVREAHNKTKNSDEIPSTSFSIVAVKSGQPN